ncbi:TPR-like protein [Dendrothele bispora CBS 962.96]|uniref:TPR-like protein n=1 Tax=Dendrothele bispora (strain CBS 962.96) TaxID=1314807 RepID=A0A4S8LLS0_DENBC|nr:TPR-like protein [Dendrothele bispora CBS 962.96]
MHIPVEQIPTSTRPHFFTGAQKNDFRGSMITNVAGNHIINYDRRPSSDDTKKITADIIASATPAVPLVFKGREELFEQGLNILCQPAHTFLAILGAGGMGKTSLALHIMDSALVKNKFAGRCYFIPCELFEDAESLVQGLIHVMELTVQENQSKQKVLFDHLQSAHSDLLIVFDNFETPWNHSGARSGVKNLLEKIAQHSRISLIVTMRGSVGPGDIPWIKLGGKSGIPTLLPDAAKEAFKAFAGDNLQNIGNYEPEIDSLMDQLEYVPLAIRLSAQHVKRVSMKVLMRMWKTHKTSMLNEDGRELEQLTSVSFSIDLSIKVFKVTGNTLRLLSAIAFLPDGVPMWSEHLDGMFRDKKEWDLEVSTLLESSLIHEHYEGIKMLAPVREHIVLTHRICQDDIDELERFYIQFLEDLPDNDMQAQPGLQLHINNIEKIFKAQISTLSGHSKILCVSAVQVLGRFSKFNSVSVDLIDLILQNDQNTRKDDKVNLKLGRAGMLRWMGRFRDAEAQVMPVKESFNEEGDVSQSEANILGRCFDILRGIYYAQAQYEKAINMNLQAQVYFKQSKNQWAQADSMYWLGNIHYMQARFKEASEMFSEAQQLSQQIGNELGVAECLQRLGDIYLMQDRYDEAIKMISDAQKQFETFGNQLRASECLLSLGQLYRMQKKYDEATEMTLKGQKQSEEIGDEVGVAGCLKSLGIICMEQAQYDEAVDMLSKAQMQYQSIGRIVDVAWCYQYLGRTYRHQGNYEKANEALNEALELLKEFPEEKYTIGLTLWEFGNFSFDMEDFSEARKKYQEARNIFELHGQLDKWVDECSEALAKLDEAEPATSISI